MKKLYLLCAILIALTSGSNAQSHTGSMIWKWDTVICYNEQDLVIERLIQSFDENGFVTGQLNEKRTSGEWVNDSRITNTNNAGGKVISSLTQLWQSNAWLNYSRVSVEYDFNGHIILESVEKFSGANWVNYIKRSYSYDGLGRKYPCYRSDGPREPGKTT
ncbi:MAG: hypothetical protein IPH84_10780 [Bacteroidales bacterium]|nr:hypothetical protein [Bacteroidales bacterium]